MNATTHGTPCILSRIAIHPGGERSLRWRIAILVSGAIAISYLDRQTLPWFDQAIESDIPHRQSDQGVADLQSAFSPTYGVMYLGGGWCWTASERGAGFCSSWSLVAGLRQPRIRGRRDRAGGESIVCLGRWRRWRVPGCDPRGGRMVRAAGTGGGLGIINAGTAVGCGDRTAADCADLRARQLGGLELALASWWRARGSPGRCWWWTSYRTPSAATERAKLSTRRAAAGTDRSLGSWPDEA